MPKGTAKEEIQVMKTFLSFIQLRESELPTEALYGELQHVEDRLLRLRRYIPADGPAYAIMQTAIDTVHQVGAIISMSESVDSDLIAWATQRSAQDTAFRRELSLSYDHDKDVAMIKAAIKKCEADIAAGRDVATNQRRLNSYTEMLIPVEMYSDL
jgi:hypothetical protein